MKKYLFLCISISSFLFAQVDRWDAKDYHFNSEEQFQVAKHIVENLPLQGGKAVLDIGCGDGKITAMIQQKNQQGRTVGVDISPSMITYAKKMFSYVEFEQKDAHFIEYDHEFDLVVSFTAMQWITDQSKALEAIHKALKKEGQVIIEMPQGLPKPLESALNKVINQPRWKSYFVGYAPDWRFYECNEYQTLMQQASFAVESIVSREITHVFPSKQAFMGFLQQWFPYLSQLVSDKDKSLFLEQVVDEYLKNLKITSKEVPFAVRRLNAVAKAI